MHLFFDTVWKLHIGEIPEKPPFHFNPEIAEKARIRHEEAIAAIKKNALIVGNPGVIASKLDSLEWVGRIDKADVYKWPGGYKTKETPVAILKLPNGKYQNKYCKPLPEEKKNTMENMTKEQANFVRLINEGLSVIRQKKMEYLACSVDGNPNWEYFKGKADAYEYAHKTFKRILKWTASGSVAAPKEEENFYSRVTEVRGWLLHQKMEVGDRYVVRLADALHAVSQLKPLESENTALREALKELLPIAERYEPIPEYPNDKAIIERARKLLNP